MSRRAVRLILGGAVAALGWVAATPLPAAHAMAPGPCTAGGYPSHAAIVVEHGDGSVISRCVGFTGATITAEQLLASSGIEYQTEGNPGYHELCQVDGEPQSYPAPCLAPGVPYWAIFDASSGGAWKESNWGISTLQITDGGALGVHYVANDGSSPAPPPSPWSVCSAAPGNPTSATPPVAAGSAAPNGASHPAVTALAPAVSAGPAVQPGSPPAATTPPTATAAVEAISRSAANPSVASRAAVASVSAALVVGFALIGGMLGLAVLQLLGRRR